MECSFFVAGRILLFTASRVFKKLFLVGLLTAAFNDFPAFAVKGGGGFPVQEWLVDEGYRWYGVPARIVWQR